MSRNGFRDTLTTLLGQYCLSSVVIYNEKLQDSKWVKRLIPRIKPWCSDINLETLHTIEQWRLDGRPLLG